MQQSQLQDIMVDVADLGISLGLIACKETQGLDGLIPERLATCMCKACKAIFRVVPSFSISFEDVIPLTGYRWPCG